MPQYFCRFWRSGQHAVSQTFSLHATDLQEAVALGLRELTPKGGTIRSEEPGRVSDAAAIAQTHSATIWQVPEDMQDTNYPHV